VPGLLFYTYFLIADKAWFDALPAAEQKALAEAGRTTVTDKWGEMQTDDARLVAELVAHGARQAVVPAGALAPWQARTEGVTRAFGAAHPEVMRRFRAIVDAQ
jgi:C4-dicarboxylate-binding protein DctP